MNKDLKLCTNCKHYWGMDCRHPSALLNTSPVCGKMDYEYPSVMREDGKKCGKEAVYYDELGWYERSGFICLLLGVSTGIAILLLTWLIPYGECK